MLHGKSKKLNFNICYLSHFRIKWKNDPSDGSSAYKPTNVEHLANIMTHGVSQFQPSYINQKCTICGKITLWGVIMCNAKLKMHFLSFQINILPVIWHCHDLINQTKTSKELWASVIYSAVSIGLFSVSTIFHLIACSGTNG